MHTNCMPPRHALAALLAFMAIVAIASAAEAKRSGPNNPNVSVMTRNLYLGTDLLAIATAPTLAEFEQRATAGFEQVQATDFPARAQSIAREVKRTKPDLIGLQEAALWRTGPKDGAATPATEVAYDYVALLLAALDEVGLRYSVASSTDEADIEGPTSGGFDVRLTMRDVVLVSDRRKGLEVTGRGGANYAARVPLPTVAGVFTVLRGYAYADLELGERDFRFVDTHLEAFLEAARVAQAQELVAPGGPVQGQRVIVVGDMNSRTPTAPAGPRRAPGTSSPPRA